MALADVYTNDVHENLKLYANWPIGEPAEIGDWGVLSGRRFERRGTLSDLGLSFVIREDPGQDQWDYTSKDAVDLNFSARGETKDGAPLTAKARVEITFKRENAVFLNMAGCEVIGVKELSSLTDDFEVLRRSGKWKDEYCFVSRLVRAKSSTIAISSGRSGGLVLEASADVERIDLADAELKLGIASQSSVALKVICRGGLTPLLGLAAHGFNPFSGSSGVHEEAVRAQPSDGFVESGTDGWDGIRRKA